MLQMRLKILLIDLKLDRERFLKQTSTKSYPLFGKTVIKAVLRAADKESAHQGAEVITELVDKEKYLFYDENGIPLDQKSTLDEYVLGCRDCFDVREIKNKLPTHEGHLFQIPEALENEVLRYADKLHQGFAEAYSRIKTWADFPDFRRKVLDFMGYLLIDQYFRSSSTPQDVGGVASGLPSFYSHHSRGRP